MYKSSPKTIILLQQQAQMHQNTHLCMYCQINILKTKSKPDIVLSNKSMEF